MHTSQVSVLGCLVLGGWSSELNRGSPVVWVVSSTAAFVSTPAAGLVILGVVTGKTFLVLFVAPPHGLKVDPPW